MIGWFLATAVQSNGQNSFLVLFKLFIESWHQDLVLLCLGVARSTLPLIFMQRWLFLALARALGGPHNQITLSTNENLARGSLKGVSPGVLFGVVT